MKLPGRPMITLPKDYTMADWYQERLEQHIEEFKQKLGPDEDMTVVVVLNDGKNIDATYFGFHNPNMLRIRGLDAQGNEVQLLLPHLNCQIVLTKVKKGKDAKRRPIGFQTREQEK